MPFHVEFTQSPRTVPQNTTITFNNAVELKYPPSFKWFYTTDSFLFIFLTIIIIKCKSFLKRFPHTQSYFFEFINGQDICELLYQRLFDVSGHKFIFAAFFWRKLIILGRLSWHSGDIPSTQKSRLQFKEHFHE